MSDLERLFRLCGSGPKPLENFTSAALAIAIGHDDGPIKRVMRSLLSDGCSYDDRHALGALAERASSHDTRVTAQTQLPLFPKNGIPMGYLDLVLTFQSPTGAPVVAWVEVKVHAWESGNQIDVYRQHAALCPPPKPLVLTLGRSRVRADTPHLGWTDIAQDVCDSPCPHYTWQSLGEFLAERRIVNPRLPSDPIADPSPYIEIIVGVNQRVRSLWSSAGSALAWQDGSLRSGLTKWFTESHDLTASGGPLHYGLVPAASGWEWALEVRTDNYERVPLRREQILRDAELGGLPADWRRYGDRREVLVKRLPLGTTTLDHEVLIWFDEGLRQLRDAQILEPYLEGFAAKQGRSVARPSTDVKEGGS